MRRAFSAAILLVLLASCGLVASAELAPRWRAAPDAGGLEVHARADLLVVRDGGGTVAECTLLPCEVTLAPGHYELYLERGSTVVTRKSAVIQLEVAPCVRERIWIDLDWRLGAGEGRGQIERREAAAATPGCRRVAAGG